MTSPTQDSLPVGATMEDRLVTVLNDAGLALMLSIGHRTGLLDALGGGHPATVAQLAEASGCQSRYVREWLGALTVAGIAEHAPEPETYWLTAESAALLTRASCNNLAVFMQYIAVLGAVEDRVVDCFFRGGGVGYEHFPRFHDVMAEDSALTVLAALEDRILPLVDGLVARLTQGARVLDIGCGHGRALIRLARAYPKSAFVGVDLSPEAIRVARAGAAGLANVEFLVGDAARLDDYLPRHTIDLALTFDAIHDQADPAAVLRAIRASLRDDGVYLAQDINSSGAHSTDRDHPLGPFLYAISTMHCMTVSLARDGDGLGTMWGVPTAQRMLREAGFGDITVHQLPHDAQNVYYTSRAA